MPRPSSILAFERLYLASLALYLLDLVLFWTPKREAVLASTQLQMRPDMASLAIGILLAMIALFVLASLLFWWLVARRRSVVGKWLVVVTEGVGVLLQLPALYALVTGTADPLASIVLELLATALAVAAAVMLFRPDTHAWFADDAAIDEPLP